MIATDSNNIIPLTPRFKRMAAAFHQAIRFTSCEISSGSDHSTPHNIDSAHLSYLVNSFIERDCGCAPLQENESQVSENYFSESEITNAKDTLEELLLNMNKDGDDSREKISVETQLACEILGESSSPAFKRRLMSRLRDRGFDAGLCKSRWEKFGRHPAGEYEYVDVKVGGSGRYIVEVFLAGEFEIARPTSNYTALLRAIPQVYVGRPEDLKQILKLMCNAIRECMKVGNLHVPPWRRSGYMLAKWFRHYKRTTNQVHATTIIISNSDQVDNSAPKTSIGFEVVPTRVHSCTEYFASKATGVKLKRTTSYLTTAFVGHDIE